MLISLVVAATENNVIGKNNKLLWHLPNDLRFFKNITWAMPVIMGRKTFDSLTKPLTGRTNIVITRQSNWQKDGIRVVENFDKALNEASQTDAKEVFVIGGGEIFRQTISHAHKIYLTRVHTNLDGDTFFPSIDTNEWNLASNLDFPADGKHAYSYSFQIWERYKI